MCKDCQKYQNLKRGSDFLKVAKKNPLAKIRACGKHQVVKISRFSISVPNHSKDLEKGMKHKLIKYFVAAGLLSIFFVSIFVGF